jgi:sec-independent protein translocase protein TatC
MLRKEYDEDLFKDSTMTFGEHLEELRKCLFSSLVGLVVGFIAGLFVANRVVALIEHPLTEALAKYYVEESAEKIRQRLDEYEAATNVQLPHDKNKLAEWVGRVGLLPEEVQVNPEQLLAILKSRYPDQFRDQKLPSGNPSSDLDDLKLEKVILWRPVSDDLRIRPKSLSAHEPFSIFVKAAIIVGVILASPWVFYQIWSFVAAGLYPHEKRYVHIFLPFSLSLFLAGALLAFVFVFEPVLTFLFSFNSWLGIDPDPRISEWLSFVLILPIGFGIAFQLPLVMLFLERIGIFDIEAYLSRWRIAILVIFTLSMFLTPADPYSMLLMAIPLTVLYFGGVLLCRFMPKNRSPFDED